MRLAATYVITVALSAMVAGAADDVSLPDPLKTLAGKTVASPADWRNGRRAEVLELFRANVYGRAPVARPRDLRFETIATNKSALSGRATRKEVKIHFSGPGGEGAIRLVVFIPNNAPKPVPGFLLISNRALNPEELAGTNRSTFWPVERIVARGYAAAVFHNADLDPDKDDGFKDGVHGIFDRKDAPRPPDAWGSIAAWAWGASRVMDYFETDADIDARRMAVVGHSRGGKCALWCGAEDERFALVISNESGCTGAALARGKCGETIQAINRNFPHWFCANYKRYNDKESELPVDQHELVALMAPRLVYVASATNDKWSDPPAEFRSCLHAEPVYRLFGLPGMGTTNMPSPEHPLLDGHIGYHLRTGQHDLTGYDWTCFMGFADRHWKKGDSRPTVVRADSTSTNVDTSAGWLKSGSNPIIRPGINQWDHDACYKPFALFDGANWLLWYNDRHGGFEQIGLATHPGADLGF